MVTATRAAMLAMPIGAHLVDRGMRVRVWAPTHPSVSSTVSSVTHSVSLVRSERPGTLAYVLVQS